MDSWTYHDLCIWNWFAGRCGTNNDKTMVAMYPHLREILYGVFLFKQQTTYTTGLERTIRDLPYLLAYGIYPNWPIFVKPINFPRNNAERKFTAWQEEVRKDVERCFGVLQAKLRVLRLESHL